MLNVVNFGWKNVRINSGSRLCDGAGAKRKRIQIILVSRGRLISWSGAAIGHEQFNLHNNINIKILDKLKESVIQKVHYIQINLIKKFSFKDFVK